LELGIGGEVPGHAGDTRAMLVEHRGMRQTACLSARRDDREL